MAGSAACTTGERFQPNLLPSFEADFATYWRFVDPNFESLPKKDRGRLLALAKKGNIDALEGCVLNTLLGNRFIITEGGKMGIAPPETYPGDLICVLYGGRVPYILRLNKSSPLRGPARYFFLGECYVHGCMEGEVIENHRRCNMPSELFTLC